jgi:crossover junction endodeoxyribonuclease RuvC
VAMSEILGTTGNTVWVRVLGVDPASAGPTWFGIVESDGRKFRVLRYGAWKIPAKRQKASAGAALHDVHELLCKLLQEFRPHAVAVESVFAALNLRTALRLSEVRGVVLLAAEQHGVMTHSYSPREIKSCVAGYGHADKRQMQLMVRALLEMNETPEPSHAADALAVALCHIQARRFEQRFGVSARTRQAVTPVRNPRGTDQAHATSQRPASIQPRQ